MSGPRILYGVQGTGNGHVSRARLMAAELAVRGADVHFLFSGRPPGHYVDMQAFGDARIRHGLTFATREGRVCRRRTLGGLRPVRFLAELTDVHPERYDLVLSDFEPLTAWSARRAGVPLVGLGHQYAFAEDVPAPADDPLARWILRRFAPAERRLGMHWYPFAPSVLPPLVDTRLAPRRGAAFTLVYLPFVDREAIAALLHAVPDERFVCYGPRVESPEVDGNIDWRPLSWAGFRHHLVRAHRIVCSTGFGLVSEALHLGTPVLTWPLEGQYEQRANALALEELELAETLRGPPTPEAIARFTRGAAPGAPAPWPDVASAIADWCVDGARDDPATLAASLWRTSAGPGEIVAA